MMAFIALYLFIYSVCVCVCVCARVPEVNFCEQVLAFHFVEAGSLVCRQVITI